MDDLEDLWERNENIFQKNNQELNRLIDEIPTVSSSDRNEYRQQAEEHIRNCNRAISEMEQGVRQTRGITSLEKDKYRSRIRTCKQQIKSCQNELIKAMQIQRQSQYSSQEKEERRQLLQGQEILDNTDNALIRSKQVIRETEEIAVDTQDKLYGQGKQLENVHNNLAEVNETSDRARRIMIGMARRLRTDRIIQSIIILLEVGIIGFLLYWRFFRK